MGNKNSSKNTITRRTQSAVKNDGSLIDTPRGTKTKNTIKHMSEKKTSREDASGEKLADDLTDAFYHIEREGIHCHRSLKNDMILR